MKYFNLHTHQSALQDEVLNLVNQYPNEFNSNIPYYSIGIHPWYVDLARISEDLQIISNALSLKNCLALGECGLDKKKESTSLEIQKEVFEAQLKLAQEHQKPVVIHCVGAFQEIIQIKNRLKITVPMIIHGFSKNEQVAKMMIDNGFFLSFGKHLFRNPEMKSVIKSVPSERIFLETDTSDYKIEEVYSLASEMKEIGLNEMIEIIQKNFETVFKIKQ